MIDLNKYIHEVKITTVSGEEHQTYIDTGDKLYESIEEIYEIITEMLSQKFIETLSLQKSPIFIKESAIESYFVSRSLNKKDYKRIIG